MNIALRTGRTDDAKLCGAICFEAFRKIAEDHGFPPDFPSPEIVIKVLSGLLSNPKFYSVIAELDGKIVGSNFLDERGTIAGIGPITVDPAAQNRSTGRELMLAVMKRAAEQRYPGVRLVQSAYHNRSLSLYTKLGFAAREPLSLIQGPALNAQIPGHAVRPAGEGDRQACENLCLQIHGHNRTGELLDAIEEGTAAIVEHEGRVTGYATVVGFFGHAVGESNQDLKALIGAATKFHGPGFLLPTRNTELFRWCLANGLRVVQPMTLMSLGLYNEPAGAFLPSILF